MADAPEPAIRHRLYEDVLAMLLGTLLVALGVTIYAKAMMLTGGTAGLALLLSYLTQQDFGTVFFVVNLPFYVLAWLRMGWQFTLRTFCAVALVTVFSRLTPHWIGFDHLDPIYAAVVAGGLSGIGLLMLFRHRTGLGGLNILALYIQERVGLRAGFFQMGVDLAILAGAFFVLDVSQLALSVLSTVVL
ncbi:MAG: YitT family protein, partial [Magnetospirillum gryphiswaldense]|nr:YitT family protein [Magnetospirillum gryphiswaldense]